MLKRYALMMSYPVPEAALHGSPSDTSIGNVIINELAAVRKSRTNLMAGQVHSRIHIGIILVCIGINLVYFLFRPDYFALFIAASFYVNMYYFIIVLVLQNIRHASAPKTNFSLFRNRLKEIGLKSGTTRFTKLFTNTIFLNSRTLSLGICLIFAIDILYAMWAYFTMVLPLRPAIIVISQCAIIIVFYLLVWYVKLFSLKYVKRTILFLIGFLFAAIVFFTTIIILPGITLSAFLTQSRLSELGDLFILLAVLAISQYFIVRFIHGSTSRTMAEDFFNYKERLLHNLQDMISSGNNSAEDRAETTTRLLETKIYTIKRNTISGFFPVFFVDLDFSVILDRTTENAIIRYIGDTPSTE
jgi:hypothetical protein